MVKFKTGRPELLQILHSIRPGLSTKGIIEQSSSFVFQAGYALTFNDEVACRAKSGLPKDFSGAVQAAPLLKQLEKLQDDSITLAVKKKELIIYAKRRESGVCMDAEITLPVEDVERPKKEQWVDLPQDFGDAIAIVQECAGKDESKQVCTCIHIHPKWVEASDNIHLARYSLKTNAHEPFLVRRDSIKHIIALDMTQMAETDGWVHFRNPLGVILSCRRHLEKYYNLKKYLNIDGEKMTIPKGLGGAVDYAQTFSEENQDDNTVLVELRAGKIRVKGHGVSGWGKGWTRLAYKGKALAFRATPKLLIEIAKRHNECLINPMHMRIDGGKWTYITCLGNPKTEEKRGEPIPDEEESNE